jgi:signal transduction histidine kinase
MSVRARLTLLHAALLVGATALLLALSWWLIGRHLDRTLPPAFADPLMTRIGWQYGLAILGMTLLSLGIGWIAAGRALRPLEASAEARRRFVANASHELRTPLTVLRTEAEVTLADPEATREDLREMGRVVLEASDRMEALLDGLLALAATDRGLRRREPVDLAACARRAARTVEGEARAAGVRLDTRVEGAALIGDEPLVQRLIENLLQNAVRHNRLGGSAELRVGAEAGDAVVRVVNEGPVLDPAVVARLGEPFQRGTRTGRGSGLGLSIVRAVTDAHGGTLRLRPRPQGGLDAEVRLPAAEALTAT